MLSAFWERVLHRFFEFGVVVKAFNGVLETAMGLLVLLASKNFVNKIFLSLTRGELLEDPHDRLINFLSGFLQNWSADARLFAAVYILVHGVLNIFLVIGILRNKLWAYPATIGFMTAILIYQVYRITYHHSVGLTILTVFDIFFILLTWHEYRHKAAGQPL